MRLKSNVQREMARTKLLYNNPDFLRASIPQLLTQFLLSHNLFVTFMSH